MTHYKSHSRPKITEANCDSKEVLLGSVGDTYPIITTAASNPIITTNEEFDELIEFDDGFDGDEKQTRFLCIFCYAEFDDLEAVRAHMMKEHDCVPLDNYPHRVISNGRTDDDLLPTSSVNEPPAKANPPQKHVEGDWMKPISLKDLKRKLRKTFTFK